MKLRNTTSPHRYRHLEPVFTEQSHRSVLDEVERIRFRVVGLYQAVVGPEWSSQGREEGDYLHHVQFVYGGEASVMHEGKTTVLKPGYAYWMPGVPLQRICKHSYAVYFLKFRCEVIEGVDMFLDWPERRPLHLGRWDMARLSHEWCQRPISMNVCLRLQGMLAQWTADSFPGIDRLIAHHRSMHIRFERVLDLIDRRLDASLRIQDLASAHGTSVSAFSHAFERSLGLSPKTYLNRRLNQEACRLILNTDLPVKTLAQRLRFADEFYFSRFFTKMNGTPPAHYRRQSECQPGMNSYAGADCVEAER